MFIYIDCCVKKINNRLIYHHQTFLNPQISISNWPQKSCISQAIMGSDRNNELYLKKNSPLPFFIINITCLYRNKTHPSNKKKIMLYFYLLQLFPQSPVLFANAMYQLWRCEAVHEKTQLLNILNGKSHFLFFFFLKITSCALIRHPCVCNVWDFTALLTITEQFIQWIHNFSASVDVLHTNLKCVHAWLTSSIQPVHKLTL